MTYLVILTKDHGSATTWTFWKMFTYGHFVLALWTHIILQGIYYHLKYFGHILPPFHYFGQFSDSF